MAKTPRWAVAAQVAVVVAIVGLGIWALQPGGYVRPVAVPDDQVFDHLPKDRPERLKMLIRLPQIAPTGGQFRHQTFEIAIDPAGRPVTVKYTPSPDEMPPPTVTDAAIAQIRTWQFVPFQVKGRPVHAWLVTQFTLAPEQDRPAVHVPFPPVTDANTVTMTYDEAGPKRLPRTVTVHGDGHVEIANTSVLSQQHFEATVPQSQILSLIDGFRRADFFSLKDAYGGGPSEGTARMLSITIDGQTKTVTDREGEYGGLPDAVMEVEDALQRAGGLEP